jgi:hypothetical protein
MNELASTATAAAIMAAPFILPAVIIQARSKHRANKPTRDNRRAQLAEINTRRRAALVQHRRNQINNNQKGQKQ